MPDPDLEIRGGGGGEGLVIQTLRKGGGGGQAVSSKDSGAPLACVTSVSNRVTLRES